MSVETQISLAASGRAAVTSMEPRSWNVEIFMCWNWFRYSARLQWGRVRLSLATGAPAYVILLVTVTSIEPHSGEHENLTRIIYSMAADLLLGSATFV